MNKELDIVKKGEIIFLDHYTYGLHPQEMGYGIKAYSNKNNKEYYERILEKVINSLNIKTVSNTGEVRIFYIYNNKAIISMVTLNGLDAAKRKGLYSHNIVIDLQDYIKLGSHPSTFDNYFKTENVKGLIDKIQITPLPNYEGSKPIEISTNTLKNILSAFLKGLRVKIIYKNKDISDILKIVYFLLELLPPTERLIPYITAFPEKNQSSYKLIILQEEEYTFPNNEWLIFDLAKEKDFSPKEDVDLAVNYMLDSYEKKKFDGLKECHKLWEDNRKKYSDIELCAHNFSSEIEKKKGIQPLSEETLKSKNDIIEIKEILSQERKIESIGNISLNKKIEEYNDHFNCSIDEMVKMWLNDVEPFKKSIMVIKEYIEDQKFHNNDIDEKAKSIIKKFVDSLEGMNKTLEKKVLLKSISNLDPIILITLLYCLKYFNLGEHIKRLERTSKEFIDKTFSLNYEEINEFFFYKLPSYEGNLLKKMMNSIRRYIFSHIKRIFSHIERMG